MAEEKKSESKQLKEKLFASKKHVKVIFKIQEKLLIV